ncbi:hypothetical protein SmJEL517_g03797 [Synchytrium microbalum]|uniref:HTH APSES-type domain-containing protein n=1 Tax=Synchytrium microbalum TaxID=1806994 RepID=A0A507BUQ7_9FUNG|nr:uncharacterized protein SmJEL517_g03797 [Synchytrium microbalum]TPX33180.1 hypothetical protein SmJEL517_g03797 [Synchytrium microbalum]
MQQGRQSNPLDDLAFLADSYQHASQQTASVPTTSVPLYPQQPQMLPTSDANLLYGPPPTTSQQYQQQQQQFPFIPPIIQPPQQLYQHVIQMDDPNASRSMPPPPPAIPTIILKPPSSTGLALSSTSAVATSATTPVVTLTVPTPPAGIASHAVYAAVYSGVPVYEMMCRNVAVMRRRADSFLNATQILKVAGIDKGRRTKILEREILTGEHEKVQGGYGKYQGTWIPFERGVALARQYNVEHYLGAILEFQPPPAGRSDKTPTKEEYMAATREKKPSAGSSRPVSTTAATYRAIQNAIRDGKDTTTTPFMSASPTPVQTSTNTPASSPPSGPSRKKYRADDYGPNGYVGGYNVAANLVETGAERHRAALMALFLNEDRDHIPDLLTNPTPPTDLDIDLVIDDQGHTALHWAAALGRIAILRLLVEKGANIKRLNNLGESALVRAVLVTNNYDSQSFPELLNILADAISLVDNKHRTVLHHIAFTAGIKGRSLAAKYYMECVLERIGAMAGGFFGTLIDIQDKHGDTALNIAARFGNRNLVEQLLDIGASPDMENKAGIRPSDFGIDDLLHHGEGLRAAAAAVRALTESMTDDLLPPEINAMPSDSSSNAMEGVIPTSAADTTASTAAVTAATIASILSTNEPMMVDSESGGGPSRKRPRSPEAAAVQSNRMGFPPLQRQHVDAMGMPVVKGKAVATTVERMVEDMNSTFTRDLKTKQDQLGETQSMLRELTKELADVRRQNLGLRQQISQLPELALRTKTLETALSEETARTQLIHGGMATTSTAAGASESRSGNSNKPTPPNLEELRKEVTNLRNEVHRHEVEEQRLREEINNVKETTSTSDLQYRRIIASCTKHPITEVTDDYIASLLVVAELDKDVPTPDIASFVSKVETHESGGAIKNSGGMSVARPI